MARLHVGEALRRYSGGEEELEVGGATVGAALETLFARFPPLRIRVLGTDGALHPYLLLFRNGAELPREGMLATPLAEDDLLELVGAAEGGSGDGPASQGGAGPGEDVRMRGFRERASVETALAAALAGLAPCVAEKVPLLRAGRRVLAADVVSEVDVPAFARAAMDGWAVRGEDTFGASLYDPVALAVVGESMPGAGTAAVVGPRRCVRIMTGAPLPDGADAVLPAELGEERDGAVLARDAVTPGRNVGAVGEDVRRGAAILPRGRRLRPQDLGLLASVGAAAVAVVGRPRVRIVVSGNELLAPDERPGGARIADSNTPMLRALVERDGGDVASALRLPDDRDALRAALAEAGFDAIVAAGGTSVGREDHLPSLVRELGTLDVHGVALRPSSPTGVGTIGRTRVFLLPGNPVSCLVAYDLFAGPALRTLAGLPAASPYRTLRARLLRPIASAIGRTDVCRVALRDGGVEPLAVSGASILSSASRADGFVVVPAASEGHPEGAEVTVHLYDALPPGPAA
jgi:molybdopterin molybdotransferase